MDYRSINITSQKTVKQANNNHFCSKLVSLYTQRGRKVPGHYTCIFNKTQYFIMKHTETYIFNKKENFIRNTAENN